MKWPLFLPYYSKIKTNAAYPTEKLAEFRVSLGWRKQYCAVMKLLNRTDGVQVYFLDSEYYFGARTGAIYGDMDDGERFAFFSRGCLDAMVALDFIPDVIQCNDWQTALIPTYLKAVYFEQFPRPGACTPFTTLNTRAGPTPTSSTICWAFPGSTGLCWT